MKPMKCTQQMGNFLKRDLISEENNLVFNAKHNALKGTVQRDGSGRN
jgi:hypothetical protein